MTTERIASSVRSISWIPIEAVQGSMKMPFEAGVAHYDLPPPDRVADLDELHRLRGADAFRFANELDAWIELDGSGRISSYGQAGTGLIGSTTIRLRSRGVTFEALSLPDLRAPPEIAEDHVRFFQTAGGRTGAPMPRRIDRFPFVQIVAPVAWTTLALTIRTDGTSQAELTGASAFPRHWVYDGSGELVVKSGVIDFDSWANQALERETPWGGHDDAPVVARAVSAAERTLSAAIVDGGPSWRTLVPGEPLMQQGEHGDELYLLMDGVVSVEVDGNAVAEVGPGAILGEGSALTRGPRSATVRAITPCKVASTSANGMDRALLEEIDRSRR